MEIYLADYLYNIYSATFYIPSFFDFLHSRYLFQSMHRVTGYTLYKRVTYKKCNSFLFAKKSFKMDKKSFLKSALDFAPK